MRSSIALAASLLLAIAAAAIARAQVSSIDQLLGQFRQVNALEARFREEKQIALLTTPIVSEGTLHYTRPGRLVRRITAPAPQIVLVDRDRLQMMQGGQVETIDLAAQPVVRSFVDTFSQLLAGDRAALERTYAIDFRPVSASAWQLTMRPRSAPLSQFLTEITFEGDGSQVNRMVMREVSGDVSTTTFTAFDTRRRYSDQEVSRLFSLRP